MKKKSNYLTLFTDLKTLFLGGEYQPEGEEVGRGGEGVPVRHVRHVVRPKVVAQEALQNPHQRKTVQVVPVVQYSTVQYK